MSHEVYADGWEIAGKSGMNKCIARFPDVCLSPPSPPAGPIPVPYPNTTFSTDLKKGSKSVKLDGKPAALAQQSYYKPSTHGDEAATRSFGANVITHQITGKTFFQAWSMDVKIEGKNVCRHFDITTSNHASTPPPVPPNPSIGAASMEKIKEGKCPCCGANLHDNQQNAVPMTEEDWYGTDNASMQQLAENCKNALEKLQKLRVLAKKHAGDPVTIGSINRQIKTAEEQWDKAFKAEQEREQLKEAIAEARDIGCKNVPQPPDKDCGVYFALRQRPVETDASGSPKKDPTSGQPIFKDLRAEWENGGRDAFIKHYNKKNPTKPIPPDHKIHHSTPVGGGGCPLGGNEDNDFANVVPDQDIDKRCSEIDKNILEPAQSQSQTRHLTP